MRNFIVTTWEKWKEFVEWQKPFVGGLSVGFFFRVKLLVSRSLSFSGNVDTQVYTRVPDNAVPLTPTGCKEAEEAGKRKYKIRKIMTGFFYAEGRWSSLTNTCCLLSGFWFGFFFNHYFFLPRMSIFCWVFECFFFLFRISFRYLLLLLLFISLTPTNSLYFLVS